MHFSPRSSLDSSDENARLSLLLIQHKCFQELLRHKANKTKKWHQIKTYSLRSDLSSFASSGHWKVQTNLCFLKQKQYKSQRRHTAEAPAFKHAWSLHKFSVQNVMEEGTKDNIRSFNQRQTFQDPLQKTPKSPERDRGLFTWTFQMFLKFSEVAAELREKHPGLKT